MKRKIRLILAVIICVLLTGCAGGQMKADSNPAPFSSLTWKSTEEDMQNEFGKYLEKNRLEDGGNSYRYNGTYGGEKGTVTYVFNKDGELTVMTFYCSVKNKADLTKIFDSNKEALTAEYGACSASKENAVNSKSYINFYDWETPDGTISLVEECMEVVGMPSYSFTMRCVNPKAG